MENDVKDSTWKHFFQKILFKACWISPSGRTEADRHADYPVYYNTHLFPLYQEPNMMIFFKTTESSIYSLIKNIPACRLYVKCCSKTWEKFVKIVKITKILYDFFDQSSLTNHDRIIYAGLITN